MIKSSLEEYLQILKTLNDPLGDWRKGEIQIVNDPKQIELMVANRKRELAEKRAQADSNEPKDSWADVGILVDDPFFITIRDAVLFPPKKEGQDPIPGFYLRTIYRNALKKNLGICLLPITSNKKIVLNLAFRHSTRGWCVEAPGTIGVHGESREESLARCIKSELGTIPKNVTCVTENFISERGVISGLCPIYVVEIDPSDLASSDPMVFGHYVFEKDELEECFKRGAFHHNGRKYICGDSYTSSGMYYAGLFNLI